VLDAAGRVTQLYGRRIGKRKDRGTSGSSSHLWLPGSRAVVWNHDALATSAEIILCQSFIDALSFWCAGFINVTAVAGPDSFAAEHLAALRAYGVSRVLVAFARRADGERGATDVAATLTDAGIECFRVVFPRDFDANTVAVEAASAEEALGRAIRQATWMGAGPPPGRPLTAAEPTAPPSSAPEPEPEQETPGPAGSAFRHRPFRLPASTGPQLPPGEEGPRIEPEVRPLAASPAPAPVPAIDAVLEGDELRVRLAERRWRVRGLSKVTSYDHLRLNVLVARGDDRTGERFHVDTLDLYSARARAAFVHAAASELGVAAEIVRRDLGRVLLCCEEHAAEAVRAAQAPAVETVKLTAEEETAALELLADPNLIERIAADFERVGMVGETTNALVGYLAAVSRKLDRPLGVVVQSASAAGKSALLDAVLAFVPAEERVKFSAMTGQSLYYMGEVDLAHKLLAVVEEEGATRAAYALKLLASEGELSIASTGKDASSGRLAAHTYRVAGPVALLLTTTAIDVDEELLNRCVVLTVDEDRDQTRAIHAAQRAGQTLDGLLAGAERDAVTKLHQDAQRLLEPIAVANPYAPQLGFADEHTRTRRDHTKYLSLIRAIALLHQHQRPRRTARRAGVELTYIEVTPADIAVANRLAHEVLGRSLDDTPPQTRRLLELLDKLVAERCAGGEVDRADVRFTRREVREFCGWSDFQLRVHLGRLVELEYVLVHRGGRGHSFVYELLYDGGGTDGRPHLVGLVDPATLEPHGYDPNVEGADAGNEASSSPQRAAIEGTSWTAGNVASPAATSTSNGQHPEPHAEGGESDGVITEGDV